MIRIGILRRGIWSKGEKQSASSFHSVTPSLLAPPPPPPPAMGKFYCGCAGFLFLVLGGKFLPEISGGE